MEVSKDTLNVQVKYTNEIERFVLINIIGICDALLNDLITFDDATRYFFNYYTKGVLEEKKLSEPVLEVVKLTCQLDEVELAIPVFFTKEDLNKEIEKVKIKAEKVLALNKRPEKLTLSAVYPWIDEGGSRDEIVDAIE
ncbi:DUF3969 family protein [Enterococcus wangshanyuanii]|uniref:Uncharacterized protein n=1 Tax=Enterococcus wangshanyuanii TaxID=2005703 RepID=A0ABQ1NFV0_9ENTE|nr:DUF3969 family protein [Enterococcus wangshanyuanii]GGC75590.1 hypothetical protein GCM10011573_01440 [Enterococcus wangshanyuanii]